MTFFLKRGLDVTHCQRRTRALTAFSSPTLTSQSDLKPMMTSEHGLCIMFTETKIKSYFHIRCVSSWKATTHTHILRWLSLHPNCSLINNLSLCQLDCSVGAQSSIQCPHVIIRDSFQPRVKKRKRSSSLFRLLSSSTHNSLKWRTAPRPLHGQTTFLSNTQGFCRYDGRQVLSPEAKAVASGRAASTQRHICVRNSGLNLWQRLLRKVFLYQNRPTHILCLWPF